MPYAKIQTPQGPLYVTVELQNTVFQATTPMPAPPEDPIPTPGPAFRPAPLSTFTLLAPVRPTKIVCVGRNYADHAAELGNAPPKEPLLFLKPPSSLLAPGGIIRMPAISQRIDFEGELAIVIGRKATNITEAEDVTHYIRGYTLANDVTARDLQKSDPQWTRGKGFDTFCPVGPIVSETLAFPATLTTHLNGEQRQQGTTADFIFPIPALLRYITAIMTLEPGDLILTGTPAGVAPMQPGDEVSITLPGLGTLTNTLAPAPA